MNLHQQRLAYIDWLRILAILGVLVYHSARPFIPDDPWHINNADKSNLLEEFNFLLSRFRMPLLFFLSGAVTWYMVKKRTTGQFLLLRFKRLFIPLLAGMLIVIPPQVYFERLHQGYTGSFAGFYGDLFQSGPYPEGNLSWHHLWFIAYLFLYDLLLAPFFTWCKTGSAAGFRKFLTSMAKGKRIYLVMLPSVLLYSFGILSYPQTNNLIQDPVYFFYWLLFLLVGFCFMLEPELLDSLERNRRFSLGMAFLLLLLINCLRWNDYNWFDGSHPTESWFTYLYIARHPIHTWCWVFALVGYGKKYLNKSHPSLDYLNPLIYPFYILHQTIIVILAYYVVQTPDTVFFKWIFLTLSTLFLTLMIFHLFIKRYPFTRFIFGMKSRIVKRDSIQSNPHAQHQPAILQ